MPLKFPTFIILAFLIFIPFCSYAQDQKDANPYAGASDHQIREAQAYYAYCKKDAALSAEKDCKCAAGAYLDTRMALGDNASKRDILRSIRDKCPSLAYLKSKHIPVDKDSMDYDLSKITDAQLNEAQGIYERCKADPYMSVYRDCECMAGSFLQERIDQGPIPAPNVLLMDLRGKCHDSVKAVGMEYTQCMQDASNDNYGYSRKDYCECYARHWGEMYSALDHDLSYEEALSMRASSWGYCRTMTAEEKRKHSKSRQNQ